MLIDRTEEVVLAYDEFHKEYYVRDNRANKIVRFRNEEEARRFFELLTNLNDVFSFRK